MKYTVTDLRKEFPTDDVCLDFIFRAKHPKAMQYSRVTGRKCYANPAGHQIHPLAGTIFEKSSTPLTVWFEAIYLFSVSKNGVSAKELQRHFGVTYKTAWRIGSQIRKLMEQGKNPLMGAVEIDETFYGKGGNHKEAYKNKQAILGMVERKGNIRLQTMPNRRIENVLPVIKENVERGSHIVTDEYRGYDRLNHLDNGFRHSRVKHGKFHYSWKGQNTNTIEGFWGQFKRSIRGTYHFVSPQHLQAYVNEFAFRYNHRLSSALCFQTLLVRAAI